jgi:leukotriene-A4 hydrolase
MCRLMPAVGLAGTCAAAAALALSACGAAEQPRASDERAPAARSVSAPNAGRADIHSYAPPGTARVSHVALDLATDFDSRRLKGQATLTVQRTPDAGDVVLDTKDLAIESVTDTAGHPLKYTLRDADPILGRALVVSLPAASAGPSGQAMSEIRIRYATSPSASALQWLNPSQTAGGRRPYLFSQGQAILTRTWIPTQDSPAIRQTWSARITVPRDLTAVMSGERLTPEGRTTPAGRTFEFRMPHSVPPYLIALAVGDIAFKRLGTRTGVYSEPAMLAKVAHEFADLEKMVATAETIAGPYRWGRYDVLVLPPSFPFGGMENPTLTFATPTVIAGDRSLVSLIAHELAHSWSGNLVTNATWRDFWLNEGMTTYLEARIMEALYGAPRADMLRLLARQQLVDEMKTLPPADTKLHIDLTGRDPDAGMTSVAYDKGAAFLQMTEQTVGRETFDPWLRGYFDRHAFHSITTADFRKDLEAHLLHDRRDLIAKLQLDQWLEQPGLPANAPIVTSERFDRVDVEVKRFAEGAPPEALQTKGWTTQEWLRFIAALPERLDPDRLRALDGAFGFSKIGNSEVRFAWLRVAIRNQYEPAVASLEQFLTSQGRRKFLRPLYEDLMKTAWGQPIARRIYAKARPLYHPVSASTIDTIVKGDETPTPDS